MTLIFEKKDATGSAPALDATGEDYMTAPDVLLTVDSANHPGAQFVTDDDLEALREKAEAATQPDADEAETLTPEPVISDSQKSMGYAMMIEQFTNMIVKPMGAPPADKNECLDLAILMVETEKFFPNFNPVHPKWQALATLGVGMFTYVKNHKDAIDAAKMKNVTPAPESQPAEYPGTFQ